MLERDADCAAAHWGIAMAYWGNPFGGVRSTAALEQGLAAVAKGRMTGSPTPRERAYIDAVAALFENHATASQRDRVLAYEKGMDAVVRAHPQDLEATIFYALAVNQTALPTDKTYAPQLKAAAILEPLFARYPDHPGLAHYIIHAYDHPPLAERALPAARAYAAIAPSAPHALHMPSHTFTRVGSWKESADTNRVSEQTALRQGVATEALHAMDYQTYAYLQMVQDGAARDVIERLPAASALFDPTATAGGAAPPMAGYFALAAIPARYALERGAWDEAAQLEVPSSGTPFTMAITHFARALGAARSGRPAAASNDLERARRAARSVDASARRLLGGASRHSAACRRRVCGICRRTTGRSGRGIAVGRGFRRCDRQVRRLARTARAGARALGRDAARCRRCGRRSRRVRGIDGKGARAFPRRIWRGACGRGGR